MRLYSTFEEKATKNPKKLLEKIFSKAQKNDFKD